MKTPAFIVACLIFAARYGRTYADGLIGMLYIPLIHYYHDIAYDGMSSREAMELEAVLLMARVP
jgi:hypothetical protein